LLGLFCCHFNHLVDSWGESVEVLTASGGEVWLTATTTLYQFACLAYYLTSVLAILYEVVRECYGEGRLVAS
jgi:hypothetical protein